MVSHPATQSKPRKPYFHVLLSARRTLKQINGCLYTPNVGVAGHSKLLFHLQTEPPSYLRASSLLFIDKSGDYNYQMKCKQPQLLCFWNDRSLTPPYIQLEALGSAGRMAQIGP